MDDEESLVRAHNANRREATPLGMLADLYQEREIPGANIIRAAAEHHREQGRDGPLYSVTQSDNRPYRDLRLGGPRSGNQIFWAYNMPDGPIIQVVHQPEYGVAERSPRFRTEYTVKVKDQSHLAHLVSDLPSDVAQQITEAISPHLPKPVEQLSRAASAVRRLRRRS